MTNPLKPLQTESWREKFRKQFAAMLVRQPEGDYIYTSPASIESFIAQIRADVQREEEQKWRKILNSGRKMYELGKADAQNQLREVILPKVEKFINKVESGRARSKETYRDMLEIRALLKESPKEENK